LPKLSNGRFSIMGSNLFVELHVAPHSAGEKPGNRGVNRLAALDVTPCEEWNKSQGRLDP
jgi:hypothetical protein